jgi:uncharacterized Tic20 family protein
MLKKISNFFSLFGSMSTLICCALPALFVSLGAGAALASVLARFPELIWVSEHKKSVFIFAGFMLILSGVLQWNSRNEPCPIDDDQAKACASSKRTSLVVYIFSLSVFVIGAGFAILPEWLAQLGH